MAESIWRRQMDWASFVARDHELNDPAFRAEAMEAARVVMQRARENVKLIVDRLESRKYQFAHRNCFYRPPPAGVELWGAELAERGVFLPVAFQAWLEVVGTLNLSGSDPTWLQSGYSGIGRGEVWYTDPLVVDVDLDYLLGELEEWKDRTAQDGPDEVGPFTIAFAPDDLHKANVSGGASYSLRSDRPCVDGLVFNERHGFSFTAHLRHAFAWGGFPGFEIIDQRPVEFLHAMREGLVEI